MKKIVVINHYGQTPDARGTTRHLDMALKFSEYYDCEVELWVCGNNRQLNTVHESLKYKLISRQRYKGIVIVRIRSIPEFKKNGILRQLNISLFSLLSGIMVLFGKKTDLYILSVPPLSFFNALMIKIRKSKLIIDVEDLWPLFLQDLGLRNKIVINIMETTANYLYNISDAIDTVSSSMKNFVQDKLNDKNKLLWISPLGVDIEKYQSAQISDTDYKWRDKFSIIYAGAHGVANGLQTILDAAKKLKPYEEIAFVMVGDGGQKDNLVNYARENQINNVYFEDAVPSSKVPGILKLANVCITHLKNVDSFKYVRPNKIFEYMAVAKPIICGIHGEASDIVREANAGICVEPENSDSISAAVLELYKNPENAQKMGIKGLEYIKRNGDRHVILDDYCKIVDTVLSDK